MLNGRLELDLRNRCFKDMHLVGVLLSVAGDQSLKRRSCSMTRKIARDALMHRL